jgi:3-oxoadipate enol-lactonase
MSSPSVNLPPDLPVGRVLPLPDRGEVFFRHHTGGEPGALPVLLLHGWTASADLQFWSLYERLGRRHPFVALDHRGHGRGVRTEEPFRLEDAADDAAALLVALGVGPALVLGYSMGGPIALLLARRHPQLVAGLVLQATSLEFSSTRRDRARWIGRGLLEPIMRSRAAGYVALKGLRLAKDHYPEAGIREPWLAGELRRGDPRAAAEAGRALHRFDARPWAASLCVPTAALLTTRDQVVPPSKQRELARVMRAEVVELQGDHFCPWYRGAEFAAATERLLAGVVARLADEARADAAS